MSRKSEGRPHAPRRNIKPRGGWLKNGNAPGDPTTAARCGAKTRAGSPCNCPAMRNGRCRLHGGLSTGPKTAAGIARIRAARTKHGNYAQDAHVLRRKVRALVAECRRVLNAMEHD